MLCSAPFCIAILASTGTRTSTSTSTGTSTRTCTGTGTGTGTKHQAPGTLHPALDRMAQALVIGAGVFGCWSAYWLARDGFVVTLIDAYGPANGRASSADHSRVIRAGYGSDDIYSQWATAAWAEWRRLSEDTQQQLVVPSGALFMAPPDSDYLRATAATLSRLDLPVTVLSHDVMRQRFPQINPDGLGDVVFEPQAGVIRARLAVQALVRLMLQRKMIDYRCERVIVNESAGAPTFQSAAGEALLADVYVCACGPWLPSIFPGAVGPLIRVTRQEVLNFGVPAADRRFALDGLPVWIDFEAGLYGIPDLDSQGFKVGIDRHGPSINPDVEDRVVSRALVQRTREWLALRFPALRDAPLLDARVCQYENSWNGDFLIDRHPQSPTVWIVGGGSGHGFKHGPMVGKHVADLVASRAEVEPRFSLASKQTGARRSVF